MYLSKPIRKISSQITFLVFHKTTTECRLRNRIWNWSHTYEKIWNLSGGKPLFWFVIALIQLVIALILSIQGQISFWGLHILHWSCLYRERSQASMETEWLWRKVWKASGCEDWQFWEANTDQCPLQQLEGMGATCHMVKWENFSWPSILWVGTIRNANWPQTGSKVQQMPWQLNFFWRMYTQRWGKLLLICLDFQNFFHLDLMYMGSWWEF